ncbi:MAG: aminotransferase class I/II-fold pyridoxal phosphate-dependent enzyme, partial [Phycisphaerae bacterium]
MSRSVTVNRNIVEMEYAVRGPIPQRAAQLARQGRTIIPCNLGNPQALGQRPITFYREVLSLLESPARIERERNLRALLNEDRSVVEGLAEHDCPSDYVLTLAERILSALGVGKMGGYTESKGPLFFRKAIAAYIDQRDDVARTGGVRSDPEKIYMTNGASEGARHVIEMLVADERDGIMIPIPQYPLYSATVKKVGGVQVNYYPDEDAGWTLPKSALEDAFQTATRSGVKVKAIVAINPANPTGAVLPEESVMDVVDFAEERELAIIADEVYQHNLYGETFVSFASVVGGRDIPLFSLHSTSKGFYGECGHRGGYLEVRNDPNVAGTDLRFTDVLLKQASVSLCSNTPGQVLTYLMVSPPPKGSEPHTRFVEEREAVLSDLYAKARMIRGAFSQMDGVECFGRTGAMYLFPRLNVLPPGTNDFDYCMSLLESTGICTVDGGGFGQREGTQHLRIAFLPSKELLTEVLPLW